MSLMRFKKMHVLLQTAKVLMLLKKRINIENDKNCRSCRILGLGGVPYVYMRHVSMLMAPKQVKLAMGPGISCLQSSFFQAVPVKCAGKSNWAGLSWTCLDPWQIKTLHVCTSATFKFCMHGPMGD